MPKLLIKPSTPAADGKLLDITPESAGWDYVGFAVHKLDAGQEISGHEDSRELCIVVMTGTVTVAAADQVFADIGGRTSVFDRAGPAAVYVPAGSGWKITGGSDAEIAMCSAPGTGTVPVRYIAPECLPVEVRGEGTNVRNVRNILPETEPAESLLVVEVITPGGNWSSYPPHKHDSDAIPDETHLEETYYHRLNPPQGFAFQRVYTGDRSLDETMSVEDGDVVMVPRGYHPVGAPHGYDLYYLNVMAGPKRQWIFRNDPDHDWIAPKK